VRRVVEEVARLAWCPAPQGDGAPSPAEPATLPVREASRPVCGPNSPVALECAAARKRLVRCPRIPDDLELGKVGD